MIQLQSVGVFSYSKDEEKTNQDSILPPLLVNGGYLFAVADGVGSYAGSEFASSSALKELTKLPMPEDEGGFEYLFNKIKEAVTSVSTDNESFSEAATTLTFCYVVNNKLHIGHVGDCRLYIKNGMKLQQVTTDHTQHQKLLDKKIYTKSELKSLDVKNTLTTAISKFIPLDFQSISLNISDFVSDNGELNIVILSDGAHYYWEKRPRFSEKTLSNPNSYATSLFKRVTKSGPIDDYSCIAVKFLFLNNSR